ncbi:MAG: 16S rRNA (uracil(1498)-N(3))-methyltransferase [Calditrichaeota bacterium]|nr:MAG: 16S rRNA (uracil(1498)-N(3))-methyltransferase [Calditrichota bacterium]
MPTNSTIIEKNSMARNEYFYIAPENCPRTDEESVGKELLLRGEEHRHLSKVLRHTAGEQVFATAGDGRIFDCKITGIEKDCSRLVIREIELERGEPSFRLVIAQAIPKINRFEWFLEKVVEIGAFEIWPMQTRFTEVFPKKMKVDRWQKIRIAAMKQSGRSRLPELKPLQSFDEIIRASEKFDLRWIAHTPIPEIAKNRAQQFEFKNVKTGLLLVGPEGGFCEQEIQQAIEAGISFIELGPTRLRSETAGIVASSIILNHYCAKD